MGVTASRFINFETGKQKNWLLIPIQNLSEPKYRYLFGATRSDLKQYELIGYGKDTNVVFERAGSMDFESLSCPDGYFKRGVLS